jgi:hypothetical protein
MSCVANGFGSGKQALKQFSKEIYYIIFSRSFMFLFEKVHELSKMFLHGGTFLKPQTLSFKTLSNWEKKKCSTFQSIATGVGRVKSLRTTFCRRLYIIKA